ncbi:L-threonine O-3-phosphate decarboxylase [Melghirimyces algeriensis]|uniref:threonine-phosphate decarboxylase n=1 Tax=Melghirimyces algeriensis TaxID=910412 RepID=A0A521DQ65_9BACL|nr:L-threonine O-3-phosphate decarboxylase [Melghirimyces algeriensis]
MSGVERYGHGGDRWTAGEMFARSADTFIDFSANINPLGPPDAVMRVLREALEDKGAPVLTRYPDPRARNLKRALAKRYGLSEECLMIGNGGAELIDLVNAAVRPSRVGVMTPSFAEYEASARKRGQETVYLPTEEREGFQPEPEALFKWVRTVDLAYLGHPNNPTGLTIPYRQLLAVAEEAAIAGTVLVIDEAFLDFVPDGQAHSLLSRLMDFPTTVLLRSMTKFYALPGLRLGWGVASPDWIRRIEAHQVSWSINGLAQLAGEAALTDQFFEKATHRWLSVERDFLMDGLQKLSGVRPIPGEVNYFLLKLDSSVLEGSAGVSRRLQKALGERGILIRDCSTYPGLDDTYVRVAVRSRKENALLLQKLEEVLEKGEVF